MFPKPKIGYPIGKFMLVYAVLTGCAFAVLLVLSSQRLLWFSFPRQIYLLYGITAGALLGILEAKTVLSKLANQTEVLVWKTIPIGAALVLIPLILVTQYFGETEYVPFIAFTILPAIPSILGTSGWYFSKFEKENQVKLYASVYGFKYWKEQIIIKSDRLFYFFSDLKSREISAIYWHVGSAGAYLADVERNYNADVETKQKIITILRVMKKYNRLFLSFYSSFLVSMCLFGLWLYILESTNTFGMVQIVNHHVVSGREISIALGCLPVIIIFTVYPILIPVVRRKFVRAIAPLLAEIDPEKLYV